MRFLLFGIAALFLLFAAVVNYAPLPKDLLVRIAMLHGGILSSMPAAENFLWMNVHGAILATSAGIWLVYGLSAALFASLGMLVGQKRP